MKEKIGKIEHSDCYFYVKGDKDGPTFCCHPDNKDLDYPPCKNCKKYITKETVYNCVVSIVENVKTSFEIVEDNPYGRQTRNL